MKRLTRAERIKRRQARQADKQARNPLYRFMERVHKVAGSAVTIGDYEDNVEYVVREMFRNGAASRDQRDAAIAYLNARRETRNGNQAQ